jgi:hypothetical protein
MLVDSGSDITVVSYELYRNNLAFNSVKSSPKEVGAKGININLIGCIDNACIKTKNG